MIILYDKDGKWYEAEFALGGDFIGKEVEPQPDDVIVTELCSEGWQLGLAKFGYQSRVIVVSDI